MPKSLGQIHTVNSNIDPWLWDAWKGQNACFLIDLSQQLSTQYQRNIRQMCNYKVVGIDLVAQFSDVATYEANTVVGKGRFRFMQPSKARCDAVRAAYQQVRAQMKNQGIDISKNKLYDFRYTPRDIENYAANPANQPIYNLTTLNGTQALALKDNGGTAFEILSTYNEGVRPQEASTSGSDFTSGLQTQLGTIMTQTDLVLNEGTIHSGNHNVADIEFEDVPFEFAFDATARRVEQIQWRPDPALYLNVMGGHIEVIIDELTVQGLGSTPSMELDIAVHVAGWKSFASPQKKLSTKTASKSPRRNK